MFRDRIKRWAAKNRFTQKNVYFMYLLYSKLISFLYVVMRVFPIKKNKIVFCNMKGKRYGDNPMYICDELLKRNKDYDLVWLVNGDIEGVSDRVRRVDYTFWNIIYELSTARIWVDSNMKDLGVLKRKNQLFIQTWHGSYGLKKIGKDLGDKLPLIDRKIYPYNAKMYDLMVSNSKRTSEIYRKAFWYEGKVLEVGSPRNDIFSMETSKIKDRVYDIFNIPSNVKVVMYAPTYRNNFSLDNYSLDFKRLLENLNKRFSDEWVVLIRLHPQNLMEAKDFISYTDTIINASEYSIMQELLYVSDILITDYSSCMFDFVTTGKKCFIYASDLDKYNDERGNYFSMEELPFPLAQNNEELEYNILNFDEDKYQKELKNLFERVGLNETGHASEKVADYIEEWMANN